MRLSIYEREETIRQLQQGQLDVLVVGGGINGIGILRDLALRNGPEGRLRLALIEKDQFCHAASSKNSQLIHGGLRYLKYLEFSLVQEALQERALLLRLAPHAVWPQSFLLPVYSRGRRWYYGLGLALYDFLASSSNIGRHRWLNARQALQEEPGLNPEGLRGALRFFDGRMHASRLALDLLRDAVETGALALNFLESERFLCDAGSVWGVQVRDRLCGRSFTVRARVIVSTLGPWETNGRLKLVRGSHLVLPKLLQGTHAVAYFEAQGRILFVLPFGPFRGFTLIGTTEREQPQPEPVEMEEEEEEYLRSSIQPVLPALSRLPTLGHYAALRPLISDPASHSLSAISREHQIWKSAPNVYHVGGGKYTTFRVIAQDVADRIATEYFPHLGGGRTDRTPVDGNTPKTLEELRRSVPELATRYQLPPGTVHFLIDQHGRQAAQILEFCHDPELRRPLLSGPEAESLPYLRAQIPWAKENDMLVRLHDFCTLSTQLQYLHPLSPQEADQLRRAFDLQ